MDIKNFSSATVEIRKSKLHYKFLSAALQILAALGLFIIAF